jgi:hypothetical protein
MSDLNTRASARSLYWWSSAQLNEMARRLQTTWQVWLRNWAVLPDRDLLEVRCALAWEAEPRLAARQWSTLGTVGSACAWFHVAGDSALVTSSALFGSNFGDRAESANTPIASAVVQQAHSELLEAMRDRFGLELSSSDRAPGANLFRPWSGAVVVSLGPESAGGHLLLLNSEAVNQLMVGYEQKPANLAQDARLPPPVGVVAALADKAVRVRVGLAPCELDLGALCGLRIGDIIPLPHLLDTALTVSVGGDPVCTGFLGRQGAARAVELVREARVSSTTQSHIQN